MRCSACRASGEQCSQKKDDKEYCGTHEKNRPHGMLIQNFHQMN